MLKNIYIADWVGTCTQKMIV